MVGAVNGTGFVGAVVEDASQEGVEIGDDRGEEHVLSG